MANTYKFRINHVRCIVQSGDLSNVVKEVQWTLEAVSPNNTFADQGFSLILDDPDPNSFVDFDTLYDAQVIEWIKAIESENLDQYKSYLDEIITKKENPVEIVTKLNTDPSLIESSEPEAAASEETV